MSQVNFEMLPVLIFYEINSDFEIGLISKMGKIILLHRLKTVSAWL